MNASPPDWARLRAEFPALDKWVYLDSARKTPLARCAERAMQEYAGDIHEHAGASAWDPGNVAVTRQRLGELLGASAAQLAFTKNTAEGLGIAARALELRPGDNIVLTDMEHPVNVQVWQHWQSRGVEIRRAGNRAGQLPVEAYLERIDARTRLVSTAYVTYANGYRVDVDALAEECRVRGIRLVLDAVQAAGILARRIDSLGADFVSIGAHKGLLGLTGTGVLWSREPLDAPAPVGQDAGAGARAGAAVDYLAGQHRHELGNPNFLGLHVLRRSAEFLLSIGLAHIEARVRDLGGALLERLDAAGIASETPRTWERRCQIVNLLLPGATALQAALRERGIVVNVKDGRLRASVSFYNDESDLDALLAALREIGAARP